MKLEISKAFRKRFVAHLKPAGRREIGGILLAEQIEPGHFRLADFSVDKVTGSAAHFVRSAEHVEQALSRFFASTGYDYARFNYLGEWHSHPSFPAHPSGHDAHEMRDLVTSEREVEFAALVIVKLNWVRRLSITATLFERAGGQQAIEIL